MYLFNPIWADDIPFSDPESDSGLSFSEELFTVAHRLSPQPYNDALYHYCRVNNVHREVYYQDLIKKFVASSVTMNPFTVSNEKHWICSVGVGSGFNADAVSAQLKFLLKGEPLYSVLPWHEDDKIAGYVNLLKEADILTLITLSDLNTILSKEKVNQ
jgi:hypothetical protein